MDLSLSERIVFVAGSSRGIGKAIGRQFVEEGARVAISGRSEGDLLAAASELREVSASRVVATRCDLTQSADIARALRDVRERWGHPDVLIANIGSGRGTTGWDLSDDDWDLSLERNLRGSVRLVRAFIDGIATSRRGCIILIGSITGCEATNAPLQYSAAKAALANYGKNLARQLGPKGIRVNVVAPGNIIFPGGTWERKQAEDPGGVSRMLETEVPLRRFGTPEEIASIVAFLASDRAAFMTGTCVVADGGQTRSI